MSRAPFQILVHPYRMTPQGIIEYAVFQRAYLWGEDVYVIPQYSFGVLAQGLEITLSHEHKSYRWLTYQDAYDCLKFDSGRTTLWELNERLLRG